MIEKDNDSKSAQNDEEMLFSIWKTIPVIKRMGSAEYQIAKQEVRGLILEILRKGIKEGPELPSSSSRVRHALNAQELLEEVNSCVESKVKLPNIYFHVQKLQDVGLAEVVVTIRKGKHDIAYFSRTAKFFLFEAQEPGESDTIDPMLATNLTDLITHFNPEIADEEVLELLQEFYSRQSAIYDDIVAWIEDHEEIITKYNINLPLVFSFLQIIATSDSLMVKLHSKLANLLDYQ
ncbi:MAG: hypothetical protein ACXACI_07760 [Candidatus Hodarchaeales archaeon]|jgi:hypothetical protein